MQRTCVNIMYSHSKVTACLSSQKAFDIVVYYNGNGFNISRYRLNREHTLKASSKGSVVVLGMVRGGGWGWRAPFRSTSWTGLGTFFRMAGFIVHLWEWEKWEKFTIVHKTTVVQKVAQKVAIHTSFLLLGNDVPLSWWILDDDVMVLVNSSDHTHCIHHLDNKNKQKQQTIGE